MEKEEISEMEKNLKKMMERYFFKIKSKKEQKKFNRNVKKI
jgi:hypothetical protein